MPILRQRRGGRARVNVLSDFVERGRVRDRQWPTTRFSLKSGVTWTPEESDLEEMVRHLAAGEDVICTLREVVKVVDRPQDIDNEEAMSFFGGDEGDADLSRVECHLRT
jgi:hypothetical protein